MKIINWSLVWKKFNKKIEKYENKGRFFGWRTQQNWIKEIVNEQIQDFLK